VKVGSEYRSRCYECRDGKLYGLPQLIAHWRSVHPKAAPHYISGVIDSVEEMDLSDGAFWAYLQELGIDADDMEADRG
jgi:hypothetical protein